MGAERASPSFTSAEGSFEEEEGGAWKLVLKVLEAHLLVTLPRTGGCHQRWGFGIKE